MSGNNIVADTSLLVNFFNGVEPAQKVLQDQQIWISTITEIELLSYSSLTDSETRVIRSFLEECIISDLTRSIRDITIEVRKKNKLKVPDAIIAATSIHLDFPLITMESDFQKVGNLNAIVLDLHE